MGVGLAIASLITTIGSTAASQVQASKGRKAQREKARREMAQNAAQAAADRRKALREERVRRAQLLSQAELTGTAGSSTEIAGVGMSGMIASERQSAVSGSLAFTDAINQSNQAIQSAQDRQQLFSQVASLSSDVFQMSGGFGAIGGAMKKAKAGAELDKVMKDKDLFGFSK